MTAGYRELPPGPGAPADGDVGVPLLVPAEELDLLRVGSSDQGSIGVVVLGDGDAEAERFAVVGLARSGYEAWRVIATGSVSNDLNVVARDPSRLIAEALGPEDLPAPGELVEVEVLVAAFDGGTDELMVRGWYLKVATLELGRS